MPARPLDFESELEPAEESPALKARVRALEFEFRELLTQLAGQASQHMAALQELQEAKAKLAQLESRPPLEPGERAGRSDEAGQSLFDWEVRAEADPESAAGPAQGAPPPVHLFEAPSSGEIPGITRETRALPAPADQEVVAERDRLRVEVESLRAMLAERASELERERDARTNDGQEAHDRQAEIEGLVVTLEAELEERRAAWEAQQARWLADAKWRSAEADEEIRLLRERLTSLESQHATALAEARRALAAEQQARRDGLEVSRALAAERDALERKTAKLRDRLHEADRARQQAEAEREQARAREDAERHEAEAAWRRERIELQSAFERDLERSRGEDAERFAAERGELLRERDQLRERLDVLERSRREAVEAHEEESRRWEAERRDAQQRWEVERRELLADAERTLQEERNQFELQRQALQQQLDAGRGTEAEYQALRQEAEALRQWLETARRERDEAQRRAEEAEQAAGET